jgi:hypothetical protein
MNKRIATILNLVMLAGLLLLLITRCSKLEEEPKDFVGPDNFYNTPDQIEAAFVASMQRVWGGWQFYDWMGYPEYPALDDQIYGGDLVIGDNFGSGCWQVHYQAIADLNPAIKAIEEGRLTGVSDEVKNQLKAEALFLRSWNYFNLVRLYGDIPLILETTDLANAEITRIPVAEVYDKIVEDLLFAVQYLPDTWDTENMARPSSDVAKTLLAKVYITMATAPINDVSKYADARDMAKQVMDGGRYSLVSPVEEYSIWITTRT